jgi:ligand-binding sensor domain-containing protein
MYGWNLTLLFILFSYLGQANTGPDKPLPLNITPFSRSNNLSQSTIVCSYKDRYGLLWFGTQDGLNRYDGYKITIYKHHPRKANTLPGNYINSIAEDAEGNIWVGTRFGLSMYQRKLESFVNYFNDPKDSRSLSHNQVNAIFKDKNDNIWVGSE